MRTIANQSLLDIAIQADGSVLTVFDWAMANNISITDEIPPGTALTAPDTPALRDKDVANYFAGRYLATLYRNDNDGSSELDYLLPMTFPFF